MASINNHYSLFLVPGSLPSLRRTGSLSHQCPHTHTLSISSKLICVFISDFFFQSLVQNTFADSYCVNLSVGLPLHVCVYYGNLWTPLFVFSWICDMCILSVRHVFLCMDVCFHVHAVSVGRLIVSVYMGLCLYVCVSLLCGLCVCVCLYMQGRIHFDFCPQEI